MATIKIAEGSKRVVNMLIGMRYLVHIDFVPPITFEQATGLGFNPSVWEEKNDNKIFVDGIPYKEYLKNKGRI